jgi:hypothetical protein
LSTSGTAARLAARRDANTPARTDARVWDEELRLARLAADLGFDCLWSAEQRDTGAFGSIRTVRLIANE